MLRTLFFIFCALFTFGVLWIKNPFKEEEKAFTIPKEYEKIIEDERYAKEGKEIFKLYCTSCHSIRYDGVYHTFAEGTEKLKLLKQMSPYGDVVLRANYESAFAKELKALKESFGRVPPDLSTIYLARGKEYLFNFILNPQKVLPGTQMPPLLAGQPEKVAKVVSYLRSVSLPPSRERRKRTIMGILFIGYAIILGLVMFWWRREYYKEKCCLPEER